VTVVRGSTNPSTPVRLAAKSRRYWTSSSSCCGDAAARERLRNQRIAIVTLLSTDTTSVSHRANRHRG
jgi:hypothetical protein